MYQIAAFYNDPADRAAFDSHYLNVHAKIAERLPGIVHFTVNWPETVTPDQTDPPHCVAIMYWDSKDAAMAALSGPVGIDAMNDMPNFAGAGSTITMSSSEGRIQFPVRDSQVPREISTLLELHSHPEDVSVFDLYYREVHGQVLEKLPEVASCTMNWTEPGPDGEPAPYHAISALEWASKDDMAAAATGEMLAEAATDIRNYAGRGLSTLACRSLRFV